MTRLKILLGAVLSLSAIRTDAKPILIEYLDTSISPDNVGVLSGLSCRNYDHVVHLRLAISWPSGSIEQEKEGYKRLIFSSSSKDFQDEFLFPDGSYNYQHGVYVVNGYFIVRSGGMHQGVGSNAFERIDDTKVLLNPAVKEVRISKLGCKQISYRIM